MQRGRVVAPISTQTRRKRYDKKGEILIIVVATIIASILGAIVSRLIP